MILLVGVCIYSSFSSWYSRDKYLWKLLFSLMVDLLLLAFPMSGLIHFFPLPAPSFLPSCTFLTCLVHAEQSFLYFSLTSLHQGSWMESSMNTSLNSLELMKINLLLFPSAIILVILYSFQLAIIVNIMFSKVIPNIKELLDNGDLNPTDSHLISCQS